MQIISKSGMPFDSNSRGTISSLRVHGRDGQSLAAPPCWQLPFLVLSRRRKQNATEEVLEFAATCSQ